jgi:spore coat polysaccharide biosynthesis predicted glycosyltransferase SpsG
VKRALFVVSEHGNGHKVRCGALADELRRRGWECLTDPVTITTSTILAVVDLVVLDHPGVSFSTNDTSSKVLRIVDVPPINEAGVADILVCGSAGATTEAFSGFGDRLVLAGPQYALLRPEFRAEREQGFIGQRSGTYDVRNESGKSASWIAYEMAKAERVITYGGMRAMEALCLDPPYIEIHQRNEGERLNAAGLKMRPRVVVDGRGCERVADAIEELFR